jgi:amino acid adenylation domain-containing protein
MRKPAQTTFSNFEELARRSNEEPETLLRERGPHGFEPQSAQISGNAAQPAGKPRRPAGNDGAGLQTNSALSGSRSAAAVDGELVPRVAGAMAPLGSAEVEGQTEGRCCVSLGESLLEGMTELARSCSVARPSIVMAAWAYLLHRYGAGDEITFTVRMPAGFSGSAALFGFQTVIPARSLREWLQQIDSQRLDLKKRQPLARTGSGSSSEMNMEQALAETIVDLSGKAPDQNSLLAPLTLQSGHEGEGVLEFAYESRIFPSWMIERMAGQVVHLLQEMIQDPGQEMGRLEIFPPAERRQILEAWNDTRMDYPAHASIHQLFEAQVHRTPEATALVAGDQRLTYRELNERANQLAHHLRSLEVGPDVLVGICMERTAEMVIAMLAVVKAGGAYVPLDPAYPAERLKFILEDARVHVLLTQTQLRKDLPVHDAVMLCLDELDLSRESRSNPGSGVKASHLAYVIFTSGSTGRPKGVAIEHRSVIAFSEWARTVFSREDLDGVLFSTSICFDLSVFEVFVTLSWGGKIILADSALHLPGLAAASEVVLINTVPSAIGELVRHGAVPPSVRIINLAGEPLQSSLVDEIYNGTKAGKVYDLYGPSEDTVYSTYALRTRGGPYTIGKPIANTRVYLLDSRLRPVPAGVPGELHVAGEGLAREYLNRPDLTADKFVPDPFASEAGSRMYKTGDLARYLPDGNIVCLGRIDHQVKIRGYRIELGEIESLLRTQPGLKDNIVTAREDEEGEKRLVAYIVPSDMRGRSASAEPESSQVASWQMIFDETYKKPGASKDRTFNISSWVSSYTGQAIPEPEMREWVDHTVNRILALKPRRVYEIGCGTGLLLFRIAPQCEAYHGADISRTALDELARGLGGLPQVTLAQAAADDFSQVTPGFFDTIVINSVAQYFPSVDYLVQVIERACQVLAPGGRIFLGDPRHLLLLDAFAASVELHHAPSWLAAGQLKKKIRKRVGEEKELLIDPAFFPALQERLPQISRVDVLPKRGRHLNELTCFRYDAVIHLDGGEQPGMKLDWQEWKDKQFSFETLKRFLAETKPEVLALARVPNARIAQALQTLDWLKRAGPSATLADLQQTLAEESSSGVDPEAFWALEEELPYRVDLSWANPDSAGVYDVVLRRQGSGGVELPIDFSSGRERRVKPIESCTNNPLLRVLALDLVPDLRGRLREKLPDYMVPSSFVVLPALPLTPNGKIDRKALPEPEPVEDEPLPAQTESPRTPLELQLTLVFERFLNRRPIGINVSFFELGGDSLQALKLIVEIERVTGKKLPLGILYQSPTIESLAGFIEGQSSYAEGSSLVPLQPLGNRPPLFLMHTTPGDVLGYGNLIYHLGTEQPCYGLQSVGLLRQENSHTTLPEMAAYYIRQIREFQPEGPYYLGGWCYGGSVAVEVAQQLLAAGQEVALVALIETPAPAPTRLHYPYYLRRLGCLLRMKPARWRSWLGEKFKYYRGAKAADQMRFRRVEGSEAESSPQALERNRFLDRLEHVYRTNTKALQNYRSRFYPRSLQLFNAAEQDPAIIDDPHYGWPGLAAEIHTHIIPGNHDSILMEPNVRVLAQRLSECLLQVQRR